MCGSRYIDPTANLPNISFGIDMSCTERQANKKIEVPASCMYMQVVPSTRRARAIALFVFFS
jgi:hypothetical protein